MADEDDVLPNGHRVIKGDGLNYMIYAMGMMKYLWGEDVEEFRPERWLVNGVFLPAREPLQICSFQCIWSLALLRCKESMTSKRMVHVNQGQTETSYGQQTPAVENQVCYFVSRVRAHMFHLASPGQRCRCCNYHHRQCPVELSSAQGAALCKLGFRVSISRASAE